MTDFLAKLSLAVSVATLSLMVFIGFRLADEGSQQVDTSNYMQLECERVPFDGVGDEMYYCQLPHYAMCIKLVNGGMECRFDTK